MHPVKHETFATESKVNIDPKGFHRHVDIYRTTDFGLYMARGADHPQFGYLESWLLPKLSLRVSIFHYRPGFERPQDFYIDIVEIKDIVENKDAVEIKLPTAENTAGEPFPEEESATTSTVFKVEPTWHTRDLYVDIVSLTDHPVEILDIDELAEATSQGLISADDAEHAIEATLRAVEGITRHNDDVLAWLRSLDMPISWADPESFTLSPPMES
ncbi:DUF402 domain-containing protein [Corynebacterium pseudodiphtheriticum]|uniref:DUF402 domain-containing protein n=1 Tax=Corynebacterium pseudodiphtheriticum TaxID=37637 RepID=UPI00254ECD6C|nr:DUF402 domain-containing protein [Corynebacterium pseudodiphtheriticum]MDK8479012.1 DUF402 domain-containing protein [Corynebacterium pseudodiphtheriticum]MDK8486683.1 DUF402 domain-containing protein [Corynebacterium pseudodiphtheriticum]MDK8493804.1 DUF402 domain-containing protein [Corynebacterium pseudodiphtheriticum]